LRSESEVYNPGDEGWKLDKTDKKKKGSSRVEKGQVQKDSMTSEVPRINQSVRVAVPNLFGKQL
jgi:hypothetical protein